MTLALAYVTDAGLLRPTLLSLDSALARTSGAVTVLFVGHALAPAQEEGVARVAAAHPRARLDLRRLDPSWLAGATSPKSFITPVALGRMFLPRLTETGRVLYLDGDTLVVRDLAPLAALDMGGRPLAGVADYVTLRRLAKGRGDRLGVERGVMGDHPVSGYVNSGVLLMDAGAIRAIPGRQAAMEDMAAARGFPTVDQDRINQLFAGETRLLDPAWNASWGRVGRQRADLARAGIQDLAGGGGGPAILHFHGPDKPWKPLRLSQLARGGPALWRYRRALAAFRARFPDLAP